MERSCDSHMTWERCVVLVTSLSLSGRNEVSTSGFLPSRFFFGFGGLGAMYRGEKKEREREREREMRER